MGVSQHFSETARETIPTEVQHPYQAVGVLGSDATMIVDNAPWYFSTYLSAPSGQSTYTCPVIVQAPIQNDAITFGCGVVHQM